jgi:hypothetical protein
MKNIFDVLRMKELDAVRVRKEIDALRIAAKLLAEEGENQVLEMPETAASHRAASAGNANGQPNA